MNSTGQVRPFSLLVKPASADCNLRCTYCFYLPKASLYPETKVHRMPDEVLEQLISSYMQTPQPQYVIGWQGGEPTLMGLDFFRKIVELQKKYGRPGASVGNGLQTNATLIDDDLARHLREYHFLVGASIDGPPEIHDQNRVNAGGKGSFGRAMKGIECLDKHGVEYNILVLVNSANVHRGREVYCYLRDRGYYFHQYIPCVEMDDQGHPMPYSITGEQWGKFLCDVFDEWIQNDTRKVSIRLHDAIMEKLLTGRATLCHMGTNCNDYFLIEYNGDVYPCDFFAEPELKAGNIMENSWAELQQNATYLRFGREKSEWNAACDSCRHLELCAGDCIKHRFERGGIGRISWLCEGWMQFYDHTLDDFKKLAEQIMREQEAERQAEMQRRLRATPVEQTGIRRNAPCPCGSGLKFKHCCGKR
jgi:uncharacterized protein